MGRLSPRFEFEYGDPDEQKVGVRLTLYGHTVIVSPSAGNPSNVKVQACSRALSKLRKYHPHWLVPPMPMDGHTGPEWNWVHLLEGEKHLPIGS